MWEGRGLFLKARTLGKGNVSAHRAEKEGAGCRKRASVLELEGKVSGDSLLPWLWCGAR